MLVISTEYWKNLRGVTVGSVALTASAYGSAAHASAVSHVRSLTTTAAGLAACRVVHAIRSKATASPRSRTADSYVDVVANGAKAGTLTAILAGEGEGTRFMPEEKPLAKRRQWLAFASHPKGSIVVDTGAREALTTKARSLLASGVKGLTNAFEPGDVVSLVEGGVEFARGLTNFSSRDLEKIKGLKTSEIEGVLGVKPADEVVHRDNLAVLKN